VHKRYKKQGVVFIGLTPDDERMMDYMESFLNKAGIKWFNGYGAYDTLMQLETSHFPSVWVIGTDGRVVWNMDSRKTLEEGIEEALQDADQRSS
jgi:hypothetical protein